MKVSHWKIYHRLSMSVMNTKVNLFIGERNNLLYNILIIINGYNLKDHLRKRNYFKINPE